MGLEELANDIGFCPCGLRDHQKHPFLAKRGQVLDQKLLDPALLLPRQASLASGLLERLDDRFESSPLGGRDGHYRLVILKDSKDLQEGG